MHTEHPYNLGPIGASCRRLGSDILRQELLALVSAFLVSPVLALVLGVLSDFVELSDLVVDSLFFSDFDSIFEGFSSDFDSLLEDFLGP